MNWPFPLPEDDGAARHLVKGLALPSRLLSATDGTRIDLGALSGLSVIFVYPWTGRPGLPNPPGWDGIPGAHGSTPEAEGFRDLHPRFDALGVRVLGMSGQDSEHQRELAGRLGLPFQLLSDAKFEMADALALPRFETGGVAYLKRLTIIVQDGAIAHTFYPVQRPDLHASEVVAWLVAR